jgi:sec-independent protein translocase protein TatA
MAPLFALLELSPSMLVVLGVVAVLLYGERLPEVARSIGRGLMEFQKGVRRMQDDVQEAIDSATSDAPPSSGGSALQHEDPADREETTVPKFEPPPS